MKKIELSKQGKLKGKFFAIVDNADFEWVNSYRWSYHAQGYATGRVKKEHILMHRFIVKTPTNLETDHINGNKLDNRRSNLRTATHAENNMYKKKQKNNTSGYKGVSWHKTLKYWTGYIRHNQKRILLGYFKTKEDAARSYNKAAKELFGKFALLNEIP